MEHAREAEELSVAQHHLVVPEEGRAHPSERQRRARLARAARPDEEHDALVRLRPSRVELEQATLAERGEERRLGDPARVDPTRIGHDEVHTISAGARARGALLRVPDAPGVAATSELDPTMEEDRPRVVRSHHTVPLVDHQDGGSIGPFEELEEAPEQRRGRRGVRHRQTERPPRLQFAPVS